MSNSSRAEFRPEKIISGGQTGVDRAALDAAIELGIPHGGWCPASRRAEDGSIPEIYHLTETSSPDYAVRTDLNVLDSDATLILCCGTPSGGTELTRQLALAHRKPHLVVDLDETYQLDRIRSWLRANGVKVLNVAGPRESQKPGIGARARQFLLALFGSASE